MAAAAAEKGRGVVEAGRQMLGDMVQVKGGGAGGQGRGRWLERQEGTVLPLHSCLLSSRLQAAQGALCSRCLPRGDAAACAAPPPFHGMFLSSSAALLLPPPPPPPVTLSPPSPPFPGRQGARAGAAHAGTCQWRGHHRLLQGGWVGWNFCRSGFEPSGAAVALPVRGCKQQRSRPDVPFHTQDCPRPPSFTPDQAMGAASGVVEGFTGRALPAATEAVAGAAGTGELLVQPVLACASQRAWMNMRSGIWDDGLCSVACRPLLLPMPNCAVLSLFASPPAPSHHQPCAPSALPFTLPRCSRGRRRRPEREGLAGGRYER